LAVLIAVAALAWLLWPEHRGEDESAAVPKEVEIVKLTQRHRLTIVPGTPLEQKLKIAEVNQQKTSAPLLKVTGSVVARLAPPTSQASKVEGRWDFSAPELAGAYADWLKARNDVPFNETQRVNIFKLAAANLAAKKEVADRLEKLVKAGTDPAKDLVAAKADLLQTQIQGEKDKHEAQTNVDNARRTLATLERQLFQAGVDPALLLQDTSSMAIVKGEVPEARAGLARQGEPCTAAFYAFPEIKFDGTVGSISPTISKDTRTLRVFFQVNDPKGILKPGMYCDVGLSTSPRETLLIPADGVLHVGQFDYVLVADGKDQWIVTRVKTGEQFGSFLEILSGLKPGDRVIGSGAILLKPYVVDDVKAAEDEAITKK
jgi:multidrug efflux pump subunit AcrA (membrane-fusion protein)